MYIFRAYQPDDEALIHSSWAESFYAGKNHRISSRSFHERHRRIRNELFNNPQITIRICASKEKPGVIIGWSCSEKDPAWEYTLLHYVYVKWAFQGMGIAKAIIKELNEPGQIFYTHLTRDAKKILEKKKDHRFIFLAPGEVAALNNHGFSYISP